MHTVSVQFIWAIRDRRVGPFAAANEETESKATRNAVRMVNAGRVCVSSPFVLIEFIGIHITLDRSVPVGVNGKFDGVVGTRLRKYAHLRPLDACVGGTGIPVDRFLVEEVISEDRRQRVV